MEILRIEISVSEMTARRKLSDCQSAKRKKERKKCCIDVVAVVVDLRLTLGVFEQKQPKPFERLQAIDGDDSPRIQPSKPTFLLIR